MVTAQKQKGTEKHPYMSGAAGLTQITAHFRKSFPAQVTSETLKKLGIASNNESYLLNILRFIGVLDVAGNKTPAASAVFNQHEDTDFQEAFAKLVKESYKSLFDLHSDEAWALPPSKLISFFRNSDQTSAIVGQRQASTFQALSVLSGKLDGSSMKQQPAKASQTTTAKKVTVPSKKQSATTQKAQGNASALENNVLSAEKSSGSVADVGLTVRIEINLPASGDQETYDRIFKSIRENLLNAKAS